MSSKTSGFSPTRLARMHAALLRHVYSGRLPGLLREESGRLDSLFCRHTASLGA